MIGNMDDAEAQASSRRTLRMIKSPEPGPLTWREAGRISKELSRIGRSISTQRLQEISTTGRATPDETEALRAWQQHLAHDVAALQHQVWSQKELLRKMWGYVAVAIATAVVLTAFFALMSSSPWVGN